MTGDARKLIAGVVARHQLNEWGQHDGWWECCCSHEGATPWTADHVAAEINKALGGLTRETRTNPMSSAGITTNYNTGEIVSFSDVRRDQRWVSGWSEAQP